MIAYTLMIVFYMLALVALIVWDPAHLHPKYHR